MSERERCERCGQTHNGMSDWRDCVRAAFERIAVLEQRLAAAEEEHLTDVIVAEQLQREIERLKVQIRTDGHLTCEEELDVTVQERDAALQRLAAWESGTVYATKTTQIRIETIGGSMTMAGWLWTEVVAERDQLREQIAAAEAALGNVRYELHCVTVDRDQRRADQRKMQERLAAAEVANQSLQIQSQQAFDFLAELNEWVVSRQKEKSMTETEKKPMTREEMESRISWLESCLNDGDAGRFFTMEKLLVMQGERDHLRELLAMQKGEAVASCEQQARDMIERMSSAIQWSDPQRLTASDVVELANLIAEVSQLRRKLSAIEARDDFSQRLKTLTILTKIAVEAGRLDSPVQRLTRILDIIGTFEG